MHVMTFVSILAAGQPHLDGDGRQYTRLAGQRQADVHEFIKPMATCPTDWALQGALQLPREDAGEASSSIALLHLLQA